MAEATAFNLASGTKAERKLLLTCVNVSTTETPEWEILGVGIEDSAVEFNFEEDIKTDILGRTAAIINKPQRRQSFDPYTIMDGSKLQVKLYNIVRHERWSELTNMDMLLIHTYVGEAGAYEAERFTGSAINPQSLGGSGTLDMPIDGIFGGEHTLGTASISDGAATFTKDS